MSVSTYQWELEYEELKKFGKVSILYDDTDNSSNHKPIYHKLNVNTIQKNILILPYHENSKYLMEITEPNKWAIAFN